MSMDVNPAPVEALLPDETARPYGIIGLCLSLIVILLVATLLTAAASGIAALFEIAQLGWSGFVGNIKAFIAERDEGTMQLVLMLGSLLVYAALTAAVILAARWRGGVAWRGLVAWRPWRPRWGFFGLAALVFAYNIAISALLAHVYPRSQDWVSMPHDALGALLFFLLAVVFAPVTEEIVFRGWIYTSLRPRLGFVASFLIVSAVFAGLHYDSSHLYALAVFPVGLALTWVRERTGSLKASMVFHALFNGFAFTLAYLGAG